jgi:hypothetical protein
MNFLPKKQKKMQFSVRLYLDKSTVLLRDDAFHIQTFQCVHAMPFFIDAKRSRHVLMYVSEVFTACLFGFL